MSSTQQKDLQGQANVRPDNENPASDWGLTSAISLEMIQADAQALARQLDDSDGRVGVLKHKTAQEWIEEAKKRPKPKMLFDEFWCEGELCILYADTNVGKSIMAVQIGNSISKGECIAGFSLTAEKQKILYFDFELSDKQFENRYSVDFENHYVFDDNFVRVEIDVDVEDIMNKNFEDSLSDSIELLIVETQSKVLIIDNLTYLKTETERAGTALPLMHHLRALKNKYKLSILALAHTPKRNDAVAISRNDLQGSKSLMNLIDSSFSIGQSKQDKALRYLKQMKIRQKEFVFGETNVAVFKVNKVNSFLQFELLGFDKEFEHLKSPKDKERENKIAEVIELKKQGFNNVQIAEKTGLSEGGVRKYLKKQSNS